MFHCMYVCMCVCIYIYITFVFIHQLMDICIISTFWLLWIMLLWTLVQKYLFPFNSFCYIRRCEIARLYGNSMFNFLGITTLFSTVVTPFYIPTSNTQGFQFLHIIVNTCYFVVFFIAILSGVKRHLILILIYNYLILNEVEPLFICLLTTCISSLEKYLFKSFANCWIGLFVFLLLSCSSFYICILSVDDLLDMNCKYLLPSYGLPFHFLNMPLMHKSF